MTTDVIISEKNNHLPICYLGKTRIDRYLFTQTFIQHLLHTSLRLCSKVFFSYLRGLRHIIWSFECKMESSGGVGGGRKAQKYPHSSAVRQLSHLVHLGWDLVEEMELWGGLEKWEHSRWRKVASDFPRKGIAWVKEGWPEKYDWNSGQILAHCKNIVGSCEIWCL